MSFTVPKVCSKLIISTFIILASTFPPNILGDDWCYEGNCGPKYWKGKCKFGTAQSPVNILPNSTVKVKPGKKLTFSKSYYQNQTFQIENNGHTVMLSLAPRANGQTAPKLQVEGNGWKGTYNFLQLHFHWGSEHLVKSKRFPLEMHIVHEQDNGNGGMGVLGILYGMSSVDSKVLKPIVSVLPQVQSVTTQPIAVTTQLNLGKFLPKVFDVFRYAGSLTTPPCSEQILWSVFTQRMPVSQKQVSAFRQIQDSNGKSINRNFRPTKPVVTKTRKKIFWMPVNKNAMISTAF